MLNLYPFFSQVKEYPEKYRSNCSTDGRPRFMIDKNSSPLIQTLWKLGMYYMLDVDYPTEYAMAFSIIH